MAGGSVVAWLTAWAVGGRGVIGAVFFGMVGPLVVACASWVVTERTYRRDPAAVTGQMMAAFGLKFVFFGAYVAVILRLMRVSPVPFVVSFGSYFIALHFVEAMYLMRLFRGNART